MDIGLPENVVNAADEALKSLIPEKSKDRYQKVYNAFKQWQGGNHVEVINENVLLAYFQQLSKKHSPSSLWVYYSMLRSTIGIFENINIKDFQKLYEFVKRQNVGNEVKKAKILSGELKKFLIEARDEVYLLAKVVAVFGLFGALRCDEIYKLTIKDVKEEGSFLIVTINQRFFTVIPDDVINSVQVVKKYMSLPPRHTKHEYFFVFYKQGKCSVQRVGIHRTSSILKMIVTFLGLPHVGQYTGHCLKRTSATILANTGENIIDLKRLGGCKSSSIAESYVDESVENKIKVAKRIFGREESGTKYNTSNDASLHTETSETSVPGINFSNWTNCNINVYYKKQGQ